MTGTQLLHLNRPKAKYPHPCLHTSASHWCTLTAQVQREVQREVQSETGSGNRPVSSFVPTMSIDFSSGYASRYECALSLGSQCAFYACWHCVCALSVDSPYMFDMC